MLSFAFIAISASIATRLPTISAESLQRELWATPGRDLFKTDIHAILHCGNGAPRFRLMYLPVRNRGEVPRLIMEEAKCAYEIEVVGFSQWEQYVKAGTPFGKCPVLRDFDGGGTDLANELAITRWLAQRCGLAGHSVAEQALVDFTRLAALQPSAKLIVAPFSHWDEQGAAEYETSRARRI